MPRDASRDNDGLMPTNPGRPRTPSRRPTRTSGARSRGTAGDTSWDQVATWYDGWVGDQGSRYHQALALPAAMNLLDLQRGQSILEIGSGQGVLAPRVAAAGASYTGVDASPKLVEARAAGTIDRDVRRRRRVGCPRPRASGPDRSTPVFLLSIQDMDPLEQVLASASWAVRPMTAGS
jgi:SAM-dependent methyltransferase